ncbi:MAG: aspartate aminotransferase family protein [Blastocatellales bacterium]
MTTPYPKSEMLARRAAEVIAGGVVSLNRKTEPMIVFVRAEGCRLTDADGNEYIDYHAAFAPFILGHNHREVNAAVCEAMERGFSLMGSGTTTWEIRLAESLRANVPSLERVQIANTGSEATAYAIRLSRAWTRREDIILTLGGYNGWHNDVARSVMPSLDELGPRVSPGEYPFLPSSAGIPGDIAQRTHIVNFNDADSVEYVMRRHPVACVLTEPVLQNIGVVPPLPGYLRSLRELCDRHGVLLVFDEVKTGFRAALGGYQAIAGVTPDLSVFGKAIANGYPLGALGGRADVMGLFDAPAPARRVMIAGTYNAHPFASAAAIATLEILGRDDGEVYRRLDRMGAKLEEGLESIFMEKGLTATVSRLGSAFCVYFGDHVPVDWHDLLASHDFAVDRRYRRALIERGVYHFPLPCKQGSISAAHTDADISRTLEITREAVKSL